ncbi:MAG: hypothetical protein ACYC91_18500 [Solirubrobacteraceae bacterium]
MYSYNQHAPEEEIERAKQAYFAYNRKVNEALRIKGLLPPLGQNLGGLDLNETLRSGQFKEKDGDSRG